jgi:hypothetical protein
MTDVGLLWLVWPKIAGCCFFGIADYIHKCKLSILSTSVKKYFLSSSDIWSIQVQAAAI